MRFEWDENKNLSNQRKHHVSFEVARLVFQDPHLISAIDERFTYSEERWINIGMALNFAVLVVITTVREDHHGEEIIRIISARKANKGERQRYNDHARDAG